MHMFGVIAQIIIALGIFNVWVLRYNLSTRYRGGAAMNMRGEFAAYGLPFPVLCVVGTLKIILAILLIIGIWDHVLVIPAAIAMGVLMIVAIGMHIKVKDTWIKALPAACMLLLSIIVVAAWYPLG